MRAWPAAPAIRRCSATRSATRYPTRVVRWTGRGAGRAVRRAPARRRRGEEDPGGLFTYVNYPTTEYLAVAGVRPRRASTSTSRVAAQLEALSGPSAEPGRRPAAADGRARPRQPRTRNSAGRPRCSTGRSARRSRSGCAGAFVFSWTDEWHVSYLSETRRGQRQRRDARLGLRAHRPRAASRNPRSRRCAGRSGTRHSKPTGAGRGSRSSSAPSTARARWNAASRSSSGSTIPTSR